MAPAIVTQLGFGFQPRITLNFRGGPLSTDPGLLVLRELDHRLRLTDSLGAIVEDRRDRRYVLHPMRDLLRQRIYQIAAGYEDAIDSNLLRHDPTFQTIVRAEGPGEPLATQATMSRLENQATWDDVRRLGDLSLQWFMRHGRRLRERRHQEILLDADSTEDPTHGHQELALFHGKYDTYMYHPLLIFEGRTGHLLASRLRRGTAPDAEGAVEELKRLLPQLRRGFPMAPIRFRADAAFASPELINFLDARGIGFLIGIPNHVAFQRLTGRILARAQARFERTKAPVRIDSSFFFRAKKWTRRHRILVKAEVNPNGTNVRCVVTNRPGRARMLFGTYGRRGEVETWIGELKNEIHADRLSCCRYRANALRLQLHALAYNLIHLLRHWLAPTALARAQTATIRLRLFKIGAQIKTSVRRIWFQLASGWPHQELFLQACYAVRQRAPAPG